MTGELVHWENKLQEILQHSKHITTLHNQNITLTLYRCMLNTWNLGFFLKNIERCYLCSKGYRNVEKYFIILNNCGQHEGMCRNKIWQKMFEAHENKKVYLFKLYNPRFLMKLRNTTRASGHPFPVIWLSYRKLKKSTSC